MKKLICIKKIVLFCLVSLMLSSFALALSDTRQSLTSGESNLFFVMIFLIIFGAIYALIENPAIGIITVILGASIALIMLSSLL